MLDQTFDRLQKLVSQLELLGETISQENVNQKLLRSCHLKWEHTLKGEKLFTWRIKNDLDTDEQRMISTTTLRCMNQKSKECLAQVQAGYTANGVSAANTQVMLSKIENIIQVSANNYHKKGIFCLKECYSSKKLGQQELGKAQEGRACRNIHFHSLWSQVMALVATKDETSGILKSFITGIENLVDHKVKVIRCDNGTEFKNREMNQFCEMKGILRQFSVARTPQQNGVAERRNRTLIEAARTMLADSKLPTTFWAEAVNTACYVQNRVLVVKPHNKTPYELFHGRTPTLSFMRPFGCPVTILNTIDHLGKFDGKADEGFFVGYSLNSKAFRVFNSRTRIVEENLHIRFSESTPNVVGSGPDWLFDIDALTRTMNYELIVAGTQSNGFIESSHEDGSKPSSDDGKKVDEDPRKDSECNDQEKEDNVNSTNNVNAASTNEVNVVGEKTSIELPFDPNMPALEDYSIFDFSRNDEDDGAMADMNNLDTKIQVIHILTTRIHKDHPLDQKELCNAFEKLMHEKSQMSSMGELTFFLGLQVQQKKDGIFISQDKYVVETLKKFVFTKVKTASTPMETQKPLLKDEYGEEVDVHMYRSMIGSLMYLISSRPDIMFAVCA
ncbi:putative ribonuclease H-like domain-containing protein, partial [Tanacetum coccineum]